MSKQVSTRSAKVSLKYKLSTQPATHTADFTLTFSVVFVFYFLLFILIFGLQSKCSNTAGVSASPALLIKTFSISPISVVPQFLAASPSTSTSLPSQLQKTSSSSTLLLLLCFFFQLFHLCGNYQEKVILTPYF